MIKEFKINDILSAVNAILKNEEKNNQKVENKYYDDQDENLHNNNRAKSNKSEILVLDQMID
jgi:hydrogenase maturation factor